MIAKILQNVEFGAKCNNIQVDGISFIEKLSFNAFNEGTHLEHCIKMHKRLFKVDAKKIGGDTGLLVQPIVTSAKRWASRPHLSSVVV